MRKINAICWMLLASGLFFSSCQQESEEQIEPTAQKVPDLVVSQLQDLGFHTDDGLFKVEDGYVVEGDIFLSEESLASMHAAKKLPLASEEQYHTDHLVAGSPRVITVYVDSKFKPKYFDATDAALERYNNEDLGLTFQRVNSALGADIRIQASPRYYALFGILGSAGFPTVSGDPFRRILLTAAYYDNVSDMGALTTTIAHEIGHCIGFRHTDFMDRSFSCGGAPSDEGEAGVGANHIPGTPEGPEEGSWMLACSDGSDKPFTENDKEALDYLY